MLIQSNTSSRRSRLPGEESHRLSQGDRIVDIDVGVSTGSPLLNLVMHFPLGQSMTERFGYPRRGNPRRRTQSRRVARWSLLQLADESKRTPEGNFLDVISEKMGGPTDL